MHICHVTSALAGGPATSIGLLSRTQVAVGHRVSLVYSYTRDEIWPYRKHLDHLHAVVPWRVHRPIGLSDLAAWLDLVAIVRHLAPDIVHLHCSKAGALGRLVARQLGLAAVYSPRGVAFLRTASPLKQLLYQTLEGLMARGTEPVVACSESEARHLRRIVRSVRVIPNAVDLADIATIEPAERRSDTRFLVGILGLVKDQRLPRLVRRICECAPKSWQWLWVGDGPLRSELEGLPNLTVTGWCDHRQGLRMIASVDAVLHASRWEGMPNALLEVMALGKPAVVSDVVGTRDVASDGIEALLVRGVYEVQPYIDALERLEKDQDLRRCLGERARERISRHHDARFLAARWEELYQEVLSRPRRSKRGRGRSAAIAAGSPTARWPLWHRPISGR